MFEAAIDLMSYITLEVKAHSEWYKDDDLSLGGVYATDKKQDDGSDLKTIKAYLTSYRGEGALPRYPPPLPCESGGGH